MNNNLDVRHILDRAQLSEENYFQSLIEQASIKRLLTEHDIERIQYECLNLLADKTEQYNSGDSSSIRVEKAQEIMNSIFFTIGLCLKTYPHPDNAVNALKRETMSELYQKGRKRIGTMLTETKLIHTKLLSQLVNTPNVFYRSTIEGGILGFFKLYYPDYGAQEIHMTADYPICNPIPKLMGIEFIKAYVEAIYYENCFCSFFSAEDIHHLLCGYAADYYELSLNIYEPVLTTAIGCVIAEIDFRYLDITVQSIGVLSKFFSRKTKDEITTIIYNAAAELNQQLQFSQGLYLYIKSSLSGIVNKIVIAAHDNTLNRIFCTPAYPEDNPKIIFSYGDKMDDELYRKVIDRIVQCHSTQGKIEIIKKHIHSLADLEDVLLDAEMTNLEMQAVLHELSLPEIAALSKKYHLQLDIDAYNLREQEQLLRENLKLFISTLPIAQQEMLKQTETALQEE